MKDAAMILLLVAIVFIYVHMLVIQHIISMIVSYGLVVIALIMTIIYFRRQLKTSGGL